MDQIYLEAGRQPQGLVHLLHTPATPTCITSKTASDHAGNSLVTVSTKEHAACLVEHAAAELTAMQIIARDAVP